MVDDVCDMLSGVLCGLVGDAACGLVGGAAGIDKLCRKLWPKRKKPPTPAQAAAADWREIGKVKWPAPVCGQNCGHLLGKDCQTCTSFYPWDHTCSKNEALCNSKACNAKGNGTKFCFDSANTCSSTAAGAPNQAPPLKAISSTRSKAWGACPKGTDAECTGCDDAVCPAADTAHAPAGAFTNYTMCDVPTKRCIPTARITFFGGGDHPILPTGGVPMKISLLKSPLAIFRLLKEVNETGFVELEVTGTVRLRYGQDGSDPALGTTRPPDFVYLTCNFTQVVRACADSTEATRTVFGAQKCTNRSWSPAVTWPAPKTRVPTWYPTDPPSHADPTRDPTRKPTAAPPPPTAASACGALPSTKAGCAKLFKTSCCKSTEVDASTCWKGLNGNCAAGEATCEGPGCGGTWVD